MWFSLLPISKLQHADVRLNVIGKLEALQQIVGVDAIVNVLVPEIVSLADDAQVISDLNLFDLTGLCPLSPMSRVAAHRAVACAAGGD